MYVIILLSSYFVVISFCPLDAENCWGLLIIAQPYMSMTGHFGCQSFYSGCWEEARPHSSWSGRASSMAADASVESSEYIGAVDSASGTAAWRGCCSEASMAISWNCLSWWHSLECTMSWSPCNLYYPSHGLKKGSDFYYNVLRHYSCLSCSVIRYNYFAERVDSVNLLFATNDYIDSITERCNCYLAIIRPICYTLVGCSLYGTSVGTIVRAYHFKLFICLLDWKCLNLDYLFVNQVSIQMLVWFGGRLMVYWSSFVWRDHSSSSGSELC